MSVRRIVGSATKVLLGQPKDYPTAMVASLSKLFEGNKKVRAAYLALMHDPTLDEQPHLLVGIEVDDDFDSISRDVGATVSETAAAHGSVDVVQVRSAEAGLSRYLIENTKPFFLRRPHLH